MSVQARVRHLNTEGLPRTPAFTNVVAVDGPEMTIYVVDGHPIEPAFGVFQKVWGRRPKPPVISVVRVFGLANPDFLVELEAMATRSHGSDPQARRRMMQRRENDTHGLEMRSAGRRCR